MRGEQRVRSQLRAAARLLVHSVRVTTSHCRTAHLQFVAVDAALRGRGLGTQLLDWALAEAQRETCVEIDLEVDARNGGAQRLYRRRGFVELPDAMRHALRNDPMLLKFMGKPETLKFARAIERRRGDETAPGRAATSQ